MVVGSVSAAPHLPFMCVLIFVLFFYFLYDSYWFILEHPEDISEREPLLETARTDSVTGAGKILYVT